MAAFSFSAGNKRLLVLQERTFVADRFGSEESSIVFQDKQLKTRRCVQELEISMDLVDELRTKIDEVEKKLKRFEEHL